MKPYSTQLYANAEGAWPHKLTRNDLFPDNGALRKVTIISAYTDLKMLKSFAEEACENSDGRSNVVIQIFLDRYASMYATDGDMRKKLNNFGRWLEKNCATESGVWLVRKGALFHSKAIVTETNTSILYMLGSLNMTDKAFKRNEELVALGQGDIGGSSADVKMARWISEEYAEKLKEKQHSDKVPFLPENLPSTSLQALMLSGVMAHEIKEADPFRFTIGLPDAFLAVKQAIHPFLKAELADSISLESMITGSQEDDGLGYELPANIDGSKEKWKQYCIDTCYGFWCPDSLREVLGDAIELKRNGRSPRFEGANEVDGLFYIVKTRRVDITESFTKILCTLERQIVERGIVDKAWSAQQVLDKWASWYDRLLVKLEKKEVCDRIILGVTTAPVPNVWSDPITSEVFEQSFVDSIQYSLSKSTRLKKVIHELKEKNGIDLKVLKHPTNLSGIEKQIAISSGRYRDDEDEDDE